MRVILLQDVDRVGHEGDLMNVADGYARNYLIPRGLAIKATSGAIRDLEGRRGAIERREDQKRETARQVAADLSEKRIVVKAVTGEGTKLHGTVTAQQIADAVAEQLHMTVDKRDVDIPEPIREVGDYLVSARLYKNVSAQIPVSVVPDHTAKKGAPEPEPQKPEAEAEVEAQAEGDEEVEAVDMPARAGSRKR